MKSIILLTALLGATILPGDTYTVLVTGKLAAGNATADDIYVKAAALCTAAKSQGNIPNEPCDASNVTQVLLVKNADGSNGYEVIFGWPSSRTVNPE